MEPANLDQLIKEHVNGKSLRQLEREFRIPRAKLRHWFRKHGAKVRSQADATRLHNRVIIADLDDVVARYVAGAKLADLCRETGASAPTLHRILKKAGVLRTRAESNRNAFTKQIPSMESLIARYLDGEPLELLAIEAGVKNETLKRHFVKRGVRIRNAVQALSIDWLDIPDMVRRYEGGESVNAIAACIGVARSAVANRLLEAGVRLRGTAEAAQMPLADLMRAATKQAKLLTVTPPEKALTAALRSLGVTVDPQLPVGPYNLDLALNGGPVAVEVEGGTAFSFPMSVKLRERCKDVLDAGWCVLYLVTYYRPINFPAVTQQILALLQRASRGESIAGKYGVIWRDGEPRATPRYQLDGLPRIPGL